jgi:predicted MFS family arabinose efflux permease
MMIPALVSVMTWFDQRRPLAVGIAICGAGMGMFLYSALVNLLLEHYELNGCFLILGAIILNGCIFGLLLRPAPQSAIANQNKISLPEKKNTFDLALFRNWKYDVFLLACFLFALGYFPVFIFVTSRVEQDLHWSHNEAAFLLTIIGMSNVGGRLMCAVLLGQACLNKLTTMAFGILVGATAVSLSFLCVDYTTMVLFSVFYGLSGGKKS